MILLACSEKDVQQLAKMNQMLIEDEKAETYLDAAGLEARMRGFLQGAYSAFFFMEGDEIVGYALLDRTKTPPYLRQFFICREQRRKGYGRGAIQLLLSTLRTDSLEVDVYAWNLTGIRFWEAMGFRTRCYSMRYKASDPPGDAAQE